MTAEQYDLIVIGAGSAARDAAKKAATEHGARVALVEHERWGGSCPNVACTPTKAYLVTADLAHQINTLASKIGIDVGPATVDLERVKARKESPKKPQPKWIEDLQAAGFDTYPGTATFVDPRTIRVGEAVLTAERLLIATGSRTAVPPIEGIQDVDWLDHVSALELTELPRSLLVVGAGAVGLEFGQTFARFGSQVTLVDALDQIAPRSDPDAARELHEALEEEGIPIILGSFVKSLVREDDGLRITIVPREGGDTRELRVERILLASGRVPNIEELDLPAAGVATAKLGIVVDDRMRTSAPGIWAAGDVNGVAQFTPVAQYQARLAVDDMFGANGATADYSVLPTAIFTDPELAGVGLTEQEAEDQGHDVETVSHPLKAVRRASYVDAAHGLFKIVFDRGTRRVLGLHVVAPGASDVVQGFAIGLRFGMTVDDLAAAHHVFPTIGEGVKAAAEQAKTTVAA
ncbi:MAG: NAD(P)/FAD-dependent oxidoreductase [Actinobacteria bacterium]|nr:MAG: NAD(P)/FAD-dependent oxidoreductase [Actinomycetota bacterium]